MDSIKNIIDQYFPNQNASFELFGNGHINDTYKIIVDNKTEYILQKINTEVFRNPDAIMHNYGNLVDALVEKEDIEIPLLIETKAGNNCINNSPDGFWRMTSFVKDSHSIEVVENKDQAFQAGIGFGWFLNKFSDCNSLKFKEVIPDFHSLTFRLKQLNEAIKDNLSNRLEDAAQLVGFYLSRKEQLLKVEKLILSGEIPTRVVHNDTKINNLLFRDDSAVAVIDLDTVGPGSVLFDFGDAIRTNSNEAEEDEQDLSKVKFNIDYFEAFTNGYLNQTRQLLVKEEISNLQLAPIYMTYIMGIRFLADFINGDVYYKTKYANHNMVRSLVQMKLIEEMESKQKDMHQIIQKNK